MPNPVGNVDTVRPDDLTKFVGQSRLMKRLRVRLASAKERDAPLGHMLLCGPAGAGKTTLAALVAKELGDPFLALTMPVKLDVLADAVENFLDVNGDTPGLRGGVLLLDEVHALKTNQEWLLPLLLEGELHLPSGRVITNNWLTVVGGTTERHLILPPLFQRFGFCPVYEDYAVEELALIGQGMARKMGLDLSHTLLLAIGAAAGGVPRNVKNLVEDARDLIVAPDNVEGREPTVEELLAQAGRTADGLTDSHIEYLAALRKLGGRGGRPVGLDRVKSLTGLGPSVLLDLERQLIDLDLIEFGPGGRILTQAGRSRARRLQVA